MCLAAWAVGRHPRFPWVLASNRDEFFDRPAAPLQWWRPSQSAAEVLGGRDLGAGGSWLALNRQGRLALLTNVREPGRHDAASPSRGALVVQALAETVAGDAWLDGISRAPRNGFNLLVADLAGDRFAWVGNRPAQRRRGAAGVWGLSNAALDTPWPKVRRLKARLDEALADATRTAALASGDTTLKLAASALAALADRRLAPDAELPDTGLPLDRERALSPACIAIPGPDPAAGSVYGTRCSTVVIVERPGGRVADGCRIHVQERSFDRHGAISGEVVVRFTVADGA
jgi:uncharacterized protein with NRDE domain